MSAAATPLPFELRTRDLRRGVLSAAREVETELFALVVPAAQRPAEFLLELGLATPTCYFATPAGSELVGLGAARILTAAGPERFRSVREQARALFAEVEPSSGLRLFGGFAFQPGRAGSDTWRHFGEARFVLPRVSYERHAEGASLRLVIAREELEDDRLDQAIELASRTLDALERRPAGDRSALTQGFRPGQGTLREGTPEAWRAQVEAIARAIDGGDLEKVVLARRVDVDLGQALSAAIVLERLRSLAPECARFSFSTADQAFLGATPERLVSKRGAAFETEAVAGTVELGAEPPSRLLESSKDLEEQAIVVRGLLRALEPIAESIEHRSTPEVHVLRHVAHLRTPVRGTLNSRRHVLELVERLHPTPAVAGTPTERALAWIAQNERDERGWYAGPVGWFDGNGDGEFVVALRSGVLDGRHLALYAGAGIVRGSKADEELAETRWKLASLLGALGISA